MSTHGLFTPDYIEFWENEYLKQIYHVLSIDREKMLDGFKTKEQIRSDWEQYLGQETSDFAVGSERIFYWLFNQFGQPNSSPIGSDMFFETYNAFVHIDIKTITTDNIGDITKNVFVGNNQNSYEGSIAVRGKDGRPYKGNLPPIYTKSNGAQKPCFTYFISILYDKDGDIHMIHLSCMPNGILKDIYLSEPLDAGKNPGKIRFNYTQCNKFKLLGNQSRLKIILWNEQMPVEIYNRIKHIKDLVGPEDILLKENHPL